MADAETNPPLSLVELTRLRQRAERERAARLEAETIAERATLALFEHNQELEARILERTHELEAARAAAEDANLVREALLVSLAHEVRTPLNIIVAACEELGGDDPADPAERGALASGALDAVDALDGALGRVLRLVASSSTVGVEPLVCDDLAGLLDAHLTYWSHRAAKAGVLLAYDVDPDLAGPYLIDGAALREVLDEAIDNAVRFGGRGVVDVNAESVVSPGSSSVSVRVADRGPGIPDDQLLNVFEPFVQLDRGPTRRYGGLGLGLALARKLVDEAGGMIKAMSNDPDPGLSIIIEVPAYRERRARVVERDISVDVVAGAPAPERRRPS